MLGGTASPPRWASHSPPAQLRVALVGGHYCSELTGLVDDPLQRLDVTDASCGIARRVDPDQPDLRTGGGIEFIQIVSGNCRGACQ